MTSKKVTRKWEIFAGRNKFLCDGRLMTAPHNGIFYLTVFLITATSILFFVFDCPFLADRITAAIPCIGAVLFMFTMGSLLRTSFSDPGIIPRAAQDEASYIEKQIEVPNSCNSPTLRPPPRTKEVLVRGQPVKLKYCYTCKIFRPPRASHCSLCDNCVDRFDHHCPWVGNCVGKRNYRFFYMFIVSLAFLAVFIFSCAITHLVLLVRDPPGRTILDALRISPASAVVSAICFLSVWSVLGMAGFHTYLITTDQTTNEDIKGSFSSKRGQESPNPYSRGGVCSNCWHVLCGPMTPSLIDRRGIVTNELRIELDSGAHKVLPSPIILPPYQSERPMPPLAIAFDTGEPIGTYSRQQTGSYTNLYRLDEKDSDVEGTEQMTDASVESGTADLEIKDSHLYSNLTHSSYMNHNLDLDPVVLTEVGEPTGIYNRPRTSSYTNIYKLSESNGELKNPDNMTNDPNVPNENGKIERKSGHLYSNVAHLGYMNHSLDLDPVVLSGSKENLMPNRDASQQRIEKTQKVPQMKFVNETNFQNVAYRREKDVAVISDELNHNTIRSSLMKIDPSDLNMNSQKQMWADRLPRSENSNIDITVLSASKLKLSHDNTMMDTALDLDSLDGSTVSLWPATV